MANTAPLHGITVLDLTNVLAGPFCCHQLVHLGAEVIKVEAPVRGDLARNLGADPELNRAGMGVSFLAQNAGKKSITLNLKHPEGKLLLKYLVADADVLVENFRPGVMERLGLSYEVLKAENPALIYCAISGFGQDGPWRDRPAYDQIIQGMSGVMSITGDAQSAPTRVGYPIADTIGGLTAAFAIAAALNAEKRGTFIDVSMMEAVLATMGWVVSNHLTAGVAPEPQGNENPTSAPSGTFTAKDGLINIAANKDEQWLALVDFLNRPDLAERPAYINREARKANRFALRDELNALLSHHPAADLVDALTARGVPAGPVLSVDDALTAPQIADRGLVAHFPGAAGPGRDAAVVRPAIKLDGEAPQVTSPPPTLGAHNDEIYDELGISKQQLEKLKNSGVI
ncbi:MAG: CoA transferase [Pseudomonadota bacterium]